MEMMISNNANMIGNNGFGQKVKDETVAQLQRIFDKLGKYGGLIRTNKPKSWWDLDLEVEYEEGNTRYITIGVFKDINGDVLYDPQFKMAIIMNHENIEAAYLKKCINQTLLGTTVVDEHDMFYGYGLVDKSDESLASLFEGFMDNMVEVGPYLTEPKEVIQYNHSLAD